MAFQFQHLEQSGIGSIFLVTAISELLWRPDPVDWGPNSRQTEDCLPMSSMGHNCPSLKGIAIYDLSAKQAFKRIASSPSSPAPFRY